MASGSSSNGNGNGNGNANGTTGGRPMMARNSADPMLASSELTPEELYAEDQSLKSGWGDETLGGQPAKVSH
jgi:hypothetical protein